MEFKHTRYAKGLYKYMQYTNNIPAMITPANLYLAVLE